MDWLRIALQVIAALGLLNVWIVRIGKPTPFRGRGATSMREEFKAYGLPAWSMWLVGALKIGVAMALLVGVWQPVLVRPAAGVLTLLMAGAFGMHLKARDPLGRAWPSIAMLAIAITLCVL